MKNNLKMKRKQQNIETSSKPIVAAFDFDKTLTDRDTFSRFLPYAAGKVTYIAQLLHLSPIFLAYLLKIRSRHQVKEALLKALFSSWASEDLRRSAESYSKEHLPLYVMESAMQTFQAHKKAGHRCILVSASLEIYLKPWAELVGFDDVIATKLEEKEHKITGYLLGPNCWGEEKVNRLRALLGSREAYTLYAYGDSRGDKELLEYADKGYYRSIGKYAEYN